MNPEEDRKERRIAWAMLVLMPLGLMVVCVTVVEGWAPGIAAGHTAGYLMVTCIVWALISLVLPILRLMRLLSLPGSLLLVIYANIYFYVIALCAGLYLNVSWCGDLGHVISSTIVTCIVFVAMCLIETRSPPHVTFGSPGGVSTMLLLVSLSFGGIWEMIEGFADAVSGTAYMVYGATDTMGDLTADLLGALIVSFCVYRYLQNDSMESVADKVRIGKKSFMVEEE